MFVSSAIGVSVGLMVIIDFILAIFHVGCLHLSFLLGFEPSLCIGGLLLLVRRGLENKRPLSFFLES